MIYGILSLIAGVLIITNEVGKIIHEMNPFNNEEENYEQSEN